MILLPVVLGASTAEALYRKGLDAHRQGRHIEAYLLFNRARALEPGNTRFLRAAHGVRRGAAQLLAASGAHGAALLAAPDSWEFRGFSTDSSRAPSPAEVTVRKAGAAPTGPARLRFTDQQMSLRLRGTLREAYLEVADAFGVQVVFDEEFDGADPLMVDLTECSLPCALRALAAVGSTFAVPLSADLLLVAADTSAKRSALEPVVLGLIDLETGIEPATISEVSQAIQGLLDIRRVGTGPGGVLALRGTTAKVDLAQGLAQRLLLPLAEVVVEVQLLAVSESQRRLAGLNLPTAFPVSNFSTLLGASPSVADVDRLWGIGGGKTSLGVGIGDAALAARMETGKGQSLRTMQVRTSHGKAATFKVGERFPIATGQFLSGAGRPSGNPAGYIQPPPVITFEDLGLELTVTPSIHGGGEVTLELETILRSLGGAAVNGVPVINNQEFKSQVRLRRGQLAVVTGAAVSEGRRSTAGPAGVARLPLLRRLVGRNDWNWRRQDLLVLVRPYLMRPPAVDTAESGLLLYGSEQRPVTAL